MFDRSITGSKKALYTSLEFGGLLGSHLWLKSIQGLESGQYAKRTRFISDFLNQVGLEHDENFIRYHASSFTGALFLMDGLWIWRRLSLGKRLEASRNQMQYDRLKRNEENWENYGRIFSAVGAFMILTMVEVARHYIHGGPFHDTDLVAYALAAGLHVLPDLPGIVSARLTRES